MSDFTDGIDADMIRVLVNNKRNKENDELKNKLTAMIDYIQKKIKESLYNGEFEILDDNEIRIVLDNIELNSAEFNSIFNEINLLLEKLKIKITSGAVYTRTYSSPGNTLNLKIELLQ